MLKRDMVSPSVTQRQSRGRCQYSSRVPMMEEPKSSFPITCLMVLSSTKPGVSTQKAFVQVPTCIQEVAQEMLVLIPTQILNLWGNQAIPFNQAAAK